MHNMVEEIITTFGEKALQDLLVSSVILKTLICLKTQGLEEYLNSSARFRTIVIVKFLITITIDSKIEFFKTKSKLINIEFKIYYIILF